MNEQIRVRPKIAQIVDLLSMGGAQKLIVTFAMEAQRYALDLTVISLSDDRDLSLTGQLTGLGVRVVKFPANHLADTGRFWRLVKFIKSEQFDMAHTHLCYANILGVLACRLAGIPVVSSLHNTHPYHKAAQQWLEYRALRWNSKAIIAVAEVVARAHQPALGKKTLEVVPNAVSPIAPLGTKERERIRTELVGESGRPLLFTAGRLSIQKGYSDLITAFSLVHITHPKAALLIAGDGPLRQQLTEQIKALQLEDHITLLGLRTDIPQLLGASDIYVSSSHWEGLSLALLEAMSAGLPVITTNVGGVRQAVPLDAGIIVPPHHPRQLAEAIVTLLNNPEQQQALGNTARRHIHAHYNASVWLQNLLAVYQKAGCRAILAAPQEVVL